MGDEQQAGNYWFDFKLSLPLGGVWTKLYHANGAALVKCVRCRFIPESSLELQCRHHLCEDCARNFTWFFCKYDITTTEIQLPKEKPLPENAALKDATVRCPGCNKFITYKTIKEHISTKHPVIWKHGIFPDKQANMTPGGQYGNTSGAPPHATTVQHTGRKYPGGAQAALTHGGQRGNTFDTHQPAKNEPRQGYKNYDGKAVGAIPPQVSDRSGFNFSQQATATQQPGFNPYGGSDGLEPHQHSDQHPGVPSEYPGQRTNYHVHSTTPKGTVGHTFSNRPEASYIPPVPMNGPPHGQQHPGHGGDTGTVGLGTHHHDKFAPDSTAPRASSQDESAAQNDHADEDMDISESCLEPPTGESSADTEQQVTHVSNSSTCRYCSRTVRAEELEKHRNECYVFLAKSRVLYSYRILENYQPHVYGGAQELNQSIKSLQDHIKDGIMNSPEFAMLLKQLMIECYEEHLSEHCQTELDVLRKIEEHVSDCPKFTSRCKEFWHKVNFGCNKPKENSGCSTNVHAEKSSQAKAECSIPCPTKHDDKDAQKKAEENPEKTECPYSLAQWDVDKIEVHLKTKVDLKKSDLNTKLECPLCKNLHDRKTLVIHMAEDCPKRVVECKFCNSDVEASEKEIHEGSCRHRPGTCQYCKQQFPTIIQLEEDHHPQCTEMPVNCSFYQLGCSFSAARRDMVAHEEKAKHIDLLVEHVYLLKCENESLKRTIENQEKKFNCIIDTIKDSLSKIENSTNICFERRQVPWFRNSPFGINPYSVATQREEPSNATRQREIEERLADVEQKLRTYHLPLEQLLRSISDLR